MGERVWALGDGVGYEAGSRTHLLSSNLPRPTTSTILEMTLMMGGR